MRSTEIRRHTPGKTTEVVQALSGMRLPVRPNNTVLHRLLENNVSTVHQMSVLFKMTYVKISNCEL